MDRKCIATALSPYLPPGSLVQCAEWVVEHQVKVMVTRERKSKNGDYRSPSKTKGHVITINGSLNPFAFLITFTHEMAHLLVWKEYKHSVPPHGNEWKYAFQQLMIPFQKNDIFPVDLAIPLAQYMRNPLASSMRDVNLYRALNKYNSNNIQVLFLEDLPIGTIFSLEDGRKFKKIEKLRKYYRCIALEGGKQYRISGLAKVTEIRDGV